jgi:agmatinase
VCTRPGDVEADFAVLGIPYGVPYNMAGVHSDAANAPTAFRHRTRRFARQVEHFDFDLGGTLFGDTGARLVDCGDVPAAPRDLEGNKKLATDTVAALLSRGATPIVLGGDDSVPTLVMQAFQPYGPVNVLQIDAHLDYRDEMHGIRDGYSSPMRRIGEMPWVGAVVQVGMRGVGSARPTDVDDARRAGSVIVTAAEVRESGPQAITTHLSDDAPWFVTIDVDGLDPTIAPGTSVPLPGGLDFAEAAGTLRWLAEHRTFAGMDIVEHFPSLDVRDMTSITLGRLVMNVLGLSARRQTQPKTKGRNEQ